MVEWSRLGGMKPMKRENIGGKLVASINVLDPYKGMEVRKEDANGRDWAADFEKAKVEVKKSRRKNGRESEKEKEKRDGSWRKKAFEKEKREGSSPTPPYEQNSGNPDDDASRKRGKNPLKKGPKGGGIAGKRS
jgi:hypothetical protein